MNIHAFLFFFGLFLLVVAAFGQSKKYNKIQKNAFLDADSYYVYGDFKTTYDLFIP